MSELVIQERMDIPAYDVDFMGLTCRVYKDQGVLIQALSLAMETLREERVHIRDINKEELRKLKALCHPDRHGGSKIAEELFKKL